MEDDRLGVRFNLMTSAINTVNDSFFFNEAYVANNREALSERGYLVRGNDWFIFFQEYYYYGRIPGTMNVQDMDEEALVRLAKMSVHFAKCIGHGLRTHNADIETNHYHYHAGSQGERPRFLDMCDVVLIACKPPPNDIDEPMVFTISYFQAYLGAINLMRAYLRYSEDPLVGHLIRWTSIHEMRGGGL